MTSAKYISAAPKGSFYLLRSFKIIFSEWRFIRLAAMPLVINTIVFMVFFFSFNYFAYQISGMVFDQGDQAWYWYAVSWFTGALLFTISILIVLFGFVAVGLIVAAPFNDMLSQAVEEKITGKTIETRMSFMALAKFTMKNEAKKMAVIIAIQIALLLINFIPIAGQIVFVVLNPLFLMLVMSFEFTSYTLDRRGYSFSEKRKYLMSHFGLTLGLGFSIWITLVAPIINFLLMPLAVSSGTLMVLENPPERKE